MKAALLWNLSRRLHAADRPRLARAVASINSTINRVDLPPEALVGRDLTLFHDAVGVVVNPQVKIGDRVRIVHGVTIGIATSPSTPPGRVVIEDDVRIGANAVIIAPPGRTITIGRGAQIGALAYVRTDVPPDARVFAPTGEIRGSTDAGPAA